MSPIQPADGHETSKRLDDEISLADLHCSCRIEEKGNKIWSSLLFRSNRVRVQRAPRGGIHPPALCNTGRAQHEADQRSGEEHGTHDGDSQNEGVPWENGAKKMAALVSLSTRYYVQ